MATYRTLDTYLQYEQPTKYIVNTEEYSDEYSTPVLTAGKTFVLGFTNETEGILQASKSPVIIFDDFTSAIQYVDFDFKVKSSAMKILHKINKEDNLKYLFYAMKCLDFTPFSHKRLWISEYSKLKIQHRTSQEQNSIASELDTLEKSIEIKKTQLKALDELIQSRFTEMFEHTEKDVIKKPLSVVCPIQEFDGVVESIDGKYWLLNLDAIEAHTGYILQELYTSEIGSSTIKFSQDNVLYSKLRPYLNKVVIPNKSGYATSELIPFAPTKEINKYYLAYFLRRKSFVDYVNANSNGTRMPRVSPDVLKNFRLPVPPLPLQNQFAQFVQQVEKVKEIVKIQIKDLQELLALKMDEYFK